jgi:hypothetical protein
MGRAHDDRRGQRHRGQGQAGPAPCRAAWSSATEVPLPVACQAPAQRGQQQQVGQAVAHPLLVGCQLGKRPVGVEAQQAVQGVAHPGPGRISSSQWSASSSTCTPASTPARRAM